MVESKERDVPEAKRVDFETASMPALFSDVTQVNVSGEHALLVFGQRNPQDESKATGVCRVYVSIPHLARLRELLDRIVDDMVQQGAIVEGKDK